MCPFWEGFKNHIHSNFFYFSFSVLMQCFCISPVIRSGLPHRILALTKRVMWQLLTIRTAEDFDDLSQIW